MSSFVRMLLLGGKGYAPDENHVLYQHREVLMSRAINFAINFDKMTGGTPRVYCSCLPLALVFRMLPSSLGWMYIVLYT